MKPNLILAKYMIDSAIVLWNNKYDITERIFRMGLPYVRKIC
jgi:hypothetical protein